MTAHCRWMVLALVAFFVCPAAIHACSCVVVNNKTCAVAGYQDIFVGEVTSIEHPGGSFKVHMKVQRTYKGSAEGEALVYTADNDGACGYSFHERETYVVYAARDNDGFFPVSSCGDTKPLSVAKGAELRFLATLGKPPRTGRIFGRLTRAAKGGDSEKPSPLADIVVFVNDGKKGHFARTDTKGNFDISGVPEGTYTLQARLPQSLTLPVPEPSERIRVSPHECVFAEIAAVNNASISGKVIAPPGKTAAGIMVWALDDSFYQATTDASGHYSFSGLEPGDYFVGVNIAYGYPNVHTPYLRTYYPATADANAAREISVKGPSHFDNIDITLPAQLDPVEIAIESVSDDGRALPDAYVAYVPQGYSVMVHDIRTGTDGRATYSFLRGVRYVLTGHVAMGKDAFGCMPETTIGPDNFPSPLRVAFNHENCRLEQNKQLGEDFRNRQMKGKYTEVPIYADWPSGAAASDVAVTISKHWTAGAAWVFLSQSTDGDGKVIMPLPLADQFELYAAGRDANDYSCRSKQLRVDTTKGVRWREVDTDPWQTGEIHLKLSGEGCGLHASPFF